MAELPPGLDVSPEVRRLLERVVECCRSEFGDLVDSVYLTGSQLEGSATPASDVDLIVLLRGAPTGEERDRLKGALDAVPRPGAPELGALLLRDSDLAGGLPEYARSAHPILGEGRLAGAPPMDQTRALRRWTSGSLRLAALVRGETEGLVAPLTVPMDPPFGFSIPLRGGRASTKNFVSLVARMAGALVIRGSGEQPRSKSGCIRAYRELGARPFGEWVARFYEALNRRWGYEVPEAEGERAELARLLAELPAFENHFLAEVSGEVREAEESPHEEDVAWAESCRRLVR